MEAAARGQVTSGPHFDPLLPPPATRVDQCLGRCTRYVPCWITARMSLRLTKRVAGSCTTQ